MGGLFPARPAASVLPKATDLSAPVLAPGNKPAAKRADAPPVIGPAPTIASLDQKRKSQTDALGAAGTPQTIIKAPGFG